MTTKSAKWLRPPSAADIAEGLPTVTVDDPVSEAIRHMVIHQLTGLMVVDGQNRPINVLLAAHVVRLASPPRQRGGNIDGLRTSIPMCAADSRAVRMWQAPGRSTVGQCLPRAAVGPLIVASDATVFEVATRMAHSQRLMAAVVDEIGRLVGVVRLERALTNLAVVGPQREQLTGV
jgi:CBS domain-containing protein